MPSIRYINQSAPFWDFVASLENQNQNQNQNTEHPLFAARSPAEGAEEQSWGSWAPWGHRGFAHRPHPHHHRRGGPPPPQESPADGDNTPPPPFEEKEGSPATEKGDGEPSNLPKDGPSEGHPCGPGMGRRGHCGGRRGGAHGHGRGPWGPGYHHRGGFPFGRFGGLAGAFFNENRETEDENFKPEADVFDTETAYVVHLSLPGAKKEDVGCSWDPEKSELTVSGVVYRPGDEEFLQTLALDERKVGAFERKVRLGSRANPAQVDIDGITAKLEDGILRVEVPKQDKDYVEVKMVDIE